MSCRKSPRPRGPRTIGDRPDPTLVVPAPSSRVITGVPGRGRGATIDIVSTPVAGAPAAGAPSRPPLARPRQGRVLAGVAAGTAAHLRQDPLVVRAAFVVLSALGVGVVLYGLLWLTMPAAEPGAEPVVTLKSGETRSTRQLLALGGLGLVALILFGQVLSFSNGNVILPLVLVAAGLAVIWRQLDTDRALSLPGVRGVSAGGIALAGGGVVLLLATTGQLANARNGFAATLVILVGIVL